VKAQKLFPAVFRLKSKNRKDVGWMKNFLVLVLLLLLCGCGAQTLDMTALDAVCEAVSAAGVSSAGYDITSEKMPNSTFLQGERHVLWCDGRETPLITVYVYKNAKAASKDGACLTADGSGLDAKNFWGQGKSVRVEWVDAPHFFLLDNVIVQYIGTDGKILAALQDLCGNQIAGAEYTETGVAMAVPEEEMSQMKPKVVVCQ
jgi:hypothetical protein